jgi:hypothetical protein
MNQTFTHILASAHMLLQSQPVGPSILTTDRLWASLAAVLALAGVVIGGSAVARFTRGIGPGKGRNGAVVAVGAGLIAAIIGGLVLATADGGPGTGNGVVGAGVALMLGLIAAAEGGLVLARSRRVG